MWPAYPRFLFSSSGFRLLKMAATAATGLQISAARPSISFTNRIFKACVTNVGADSKGLSWARLASTCHISSLQHFQRNFMPSPVKFEKVVTRAMSESSENKPASVLPIDLKDISRIGVCFLWNACL
ncbi:unnamed protein product [Camellia sinensis]|uniref:enoyl-[acyl-carrier-protein] reductase [NADH], chloroplastic-like isoform X1 n=2 Tax=Camellia sinensis TaxID=4442 RepID=UPI001036611C|nr:enoyl-[acyl-carrier-protein] reductase [NADH], chloroplastic-like isoform X1 [Camellia sinensis]XP_028124749.1 enoyl-[acyl-carrier-protein] reductase [NADH], chloroplastic-like isoform X1 [Camellia sinensis]XP_028124750.1 enoyl-[acyl-carrier-protein] reductase [NADH], chloroplastic-like isoform X1 [Camellia sinensis]XP_028124751.1 enoyl-[acyl-carrier-protein] reductase [NADH], chloroplastic-like isoform X1 [Camellia sinensis]XP_028124752.1 enoyl-[acyl-carrier-protein] reductase [NADH], chlor